jgi:hypothetical protein
LTEVNEDGEEEDEGKKRTKAKSGSTTKSIRLRMSSIE